MAYYNIQGYDHWEQAHIDLSEPDQTDGPGGALQGITAVQFIFDSNWFKASDDFRLSIADMDVETNIDATSNPLFHPNWMPAHKPVPVPGFRIETCIWNVWHPGDSWGSGDAEFDSFDRPNGKRVALDVEQHLVETYKNVGMDFPYISGPTGREICGNLTALSGLPMGEGHNPNKDVMQAHDGFARGPNGDTWTDLAAEDLTNPYNLSADQDMLLAAARTGAKAFRIVDYIWPWSGGGMHWMYSSDAIKRWRKDLEGNDIGIEILENGRPRTAKFGDYFASYHGYRPQPADCGLANWDDFYPPKPGQADSLNIENITKICSLLFHYEWVKYVNEESRPSAPYGLAVQPLCKPEAFDNGTDLYWLLKCAYVRGFCAEWWGTAGVILGNYYNGTYYSHIADRNHKELVELGESAAAGGSPFYGKIGKPHYWDNQANYLITYSQASSVDFKAKHDQYWGSSWAKMSNPNNREYQSFTAFTSAWSGFLQSHDDHITKVKSDVLAVSERAVSRNTAIFDCDASGEPYNLARDLVNLNYAFDGASFPIDDAYDSTNYKTIVYSPIEPPQEFANKLSAWLNSGSGRILITHSFIPSRYSAPAPARQGVTDEIQAGGQEKLLGFNSIAKTNLRSGIVKTTNSILARALAPFIGKKINLPSEVYSAPGDTSLVTLAGVPLVSTRKVSNGTVIYLHFCPTEFQSQGGKPRSSPVYESDDFDAFEQDLMDGLMQYAGARRSAVTSKGIYALKYDAPHGRSVFITYNSNANTKVVYGGELFTVYQAQDPSAAGSACLLEGQPNKTVRVIDIVTGEKWAAKTDRDGYLSLALNGWNMRGVYIDPVVK